MADLEMEVKFFLPDPKATRDALREAGAVETSARVFEFNLRFDDERGGLRRRESLLRLRKDREIRLTYKGDPGAAGAELKHAVKVFRELEVTVSDFDRTRAILEALGFSPVQTYEKYRETFALDETECCLDALPFGHFLEIEGPAERIPSASQRLGLSWAKRILANYLAIFDAVRAEHGLTFTDPTFANFEDLAVDAAEVIRRFEAGAP
jgi:adenylate cyclase class 2